MVVSYTTTILRDKRKALPSGKAITLQSARPIFRQSGAKILIATTGNKPPFDKGRFGGNVKINGGVLDTTTILKATKVSFWETFVII